MSNMDQQKLKTILDLHLKWVMGEDGGIQANLEGADLRGAILDRADLYRASFDGADLRGAILDRADLYGASLREANLRGANFRGANLYRANLCGANLEGANLGGAILYRANLCGANLEGADLRGAILDPIKADYFAVLRAAQNEVSRLYKALLDGKIDGRLYEGDCACLIGTIAKLKGCNYRDIPGLRPTADRAAERWFTGIRAGDTPDNNPVSKITRDWTEEFAAKHGIKLPTRRIVWEEEH